METFRMAAQEMCGCVLHGGDDDGTSSMYITALCTISLVSTNIVKRKPGRVDNLSRRRPWFARSLTAWWPFNFLVWLPSMTRCLIMPVTSYRRHGCRPHQHWLCACVSMWECVCVCICTYPMRLGGGNHLMCIKKKWTWPSMPCFISSYILLYCLSPSPMVVVVVIVIVVFPIGLFPLSWGYYFSRYMAEPKSHRTW